ncbi:hypothetical protein, partial [Rhodopseudomonas palustris]|uniref:hypothetical protein n=1 Tax=Rhodopseudomonas palustris TaxID=1076 RepID=UPI001A9EC8FF
SSLGPEGLSGAALSGRLIGRAFRDRKRKMKVSRISDSAAQKALKIQEFLGCSAKQEFGTQVHSPAWSAKK